MSKVKKYVKWKDLELYLDDIDLRYSQLARERDAYAPLYSIDDIQSFVNNIKKDLSHRVIRGELKNKIPRGLFDEP